MASAGEEYGSTATAVLTDRDRARATPTNCDGQRTRTTFMVPGPSIIHAAQGHFDGLILVGLSQVKPDSS